MSKVEQLITEHIDIWTSAILAKSMAGRGSNKKYELYGIKKLRELILELAVRGKLVPQDPSDEPASVLLERVAAEKERLIEEGEIKKGKPLPDIDEDEKLFELPQGWDWCRLQEIGHDWGQKKPDSSFTYIDVGSINKELGLIGEASVLNAEEAPSRARKLVKKGTVIYSTVRPYLLNIAVVDQEFVPEPIASTAFAIIHPLKGMCSSFIYRYLRSPSFVSYVESCQTGVAYPAINDKQFFMGLIPVPPANEQQRIVAKVDELMLLCDQLEQQTETSIDAHSTMVEVLLATLTDSANANELAQNWARVSEHFATLFTTEQSIEALKQTLLQLAVMGKLVPQDPNDEPAAVLLEKIAAEKAQLIKDKKIKKEKPLPPIGDDEKPFELPQGWEWERLGNITLLITKGSSPKWQGVGYTENPEDVLFVTSENVGSFTLLLDNKKYVEKKFNDIESRSILERGDFLMNIVGGSIGRTAVFNLDCLANINQAVCLIRTLTKYICSSYLLVFFNSAICVSYMFDKQVDNARANLSMGNISKFVIPVPPIAEQYRISEKFDELMQMCDQLKTNLQQSQETQVHLTDALIVQALG